MDFSKSDAEILRERQVGALAARTGKRSGFACSMRQDAKTALDHRMLKEALEEAALLQQHLRREYAL